MALWVKLNRLRLTLASERHVAPTPLPRITVSRPRPNSAAMGVRHDRARKGRH
jgi:hypothetical protein